MNTLGHLLRRAYEVHGVRGRTRRIRHIVLLHIVIDECDTRDDESGAALRTPRVVINSALVESAVGIAESKRSHRRERESVLQFDSSDAKRCE